MKEKIQKNIKYIVIVVVILFVIVFVYNYFIKKTEPVGVQEVVYGDETDSQAQEILDVLDKVTKVNINGNFFEQVAPEGSNLLSFQDLEDYSLEKLPDKDFGKTNPFLEGSTLFDNQYTLVSDNQQEGNTDTGEQNENISPVDTINTSDTALTNEERELINNNTN